MEKVIRDGKVAVLYAPEYGAGWFTWNTDYPECLFHPTIVEMVEKGETPSVELCDKLFCKDIPFFSGGADDLKIEWIPQGYQFKVQEYDGSESIDIVGITDFLIA